MKRINMKEFKGRAEHKQLKDRLTAAIRGFKDHLFVSEGQIIDRFIETLPPINTIDESRLPRVSNLAGEYQVLHNNKIGCLYGILRMSVMLWWMHEEGAVTSAKINKLCDVLEAIKEKYVDLQPIDTGNGFTFQSFYGFIKK